MGWDETTETYCFDSGRRIERWRSTDGVLGYVHWPCSSSSLESLLDSISGQMSADERQEAAMFIVEKWQKWAKGEPKRTV